MEASEQELVVQALDDITEWMRENGAGSFVQKLRPGAADSALDAAERALLIAPDLATFLGDYATRLWDGDFELHGDPALPGVTQKGLKWLGRYFAPL